MDAGHAERSDAVDRQLQIALVALWSSGAMLAAVTAVVVRLRDASGAAEYAGAAIALVLLALFTARGNLLVTTIGLFICALQPLAVVATAWELTHEISHTQLAKLREIGIYPTLGVAMNLAFSACASVLAVCAYRRRRAARRDP